jgi:hypothetical protein
MSGLVTVCAGCEIFFGIISQPATWADVVKLEIVRGAAVLPAPPVAREHFVAEPAYASDSSLSRGRFGSSHPELIHTPVALTAEVKYCFKFPVLQLIRALVLNM